MARAFVQLTSNDGSVKMGTIDVNNPSDEVVIRITKEKVTIESADEPKLVEEFEAQAALCPKCGHSWGQHDQELKGAGKMLKPEYNPRGVEDLYECSAYQGMGNWCGCEERSRQPTSQLRVT